MARPAQLFQLKVKGKWQSLPAWAEEYGMDYHTLYARIYKLKWPLQKALTTPVRPKAAYIFEE